MTEEDKNKLLEQITALREDIKEFHIEMNEHKKLGAAIYQKIQKFIETAGESTNKVVATALGGIQPEIQKAVNEGMMDAAEHFGAVAEKVGDKHNQEMTGLWRLLPMASALICLLASLAGGVIVYFLMPKMDGDVTAKLQTGAFFESVWPKLSKSEQDKLMAIAEGKEAEMPHKKSKKS